MKSNEIVPEFDGPDICERLVGITPIYLQNFVSRRLYGLRASIKPGKVREQRRLFSREDVFGIALVWLLFESGLRSKPMARILNEVAGTNKSNANLAAQKLLDAGAQYLLITRTPRGPSKSVPKEPSQSIQSLTQSELARVLKENTSSDLIAIPVGHKFEDIRKRIEILF